MGAHVARYFNISMWKLRIRPVQDIATSRRENAPSQQNRICHGLLRTILVSVDVYLPRDHSLKSSLFQAVNTKRLTQQELTSANPTINFEEYEFRHYLLLIEVYYTDTFLHNTYSIVFVMFASANNTTKPTTSFTPNYISTVSTTNCSRQFSIVRSRREASLRDDHKDIIKPSYPSTIAKPKNPPKNKKGSELVLTIVINKHTLHTTNLPQRPRFLQPSTLEITRGYLFTISQSPSESPLTTYLHQACISIEYRRQTSRHSSCSLFWLGLLG